LLLLHTEKVIGLTGRSAGVKDFTLTSKNEAVCCVDREL
jgi:hypothetical protein